MQTIPVLEMSLSEHANPRCLLERTSCGPRSTALHVLTQAACRLTDKAVCLQPYQQMYGTHGAMLLGGYPAQAYPPHAMNDAQHSLYQAMLVHQQHPSPLTSFPGTAAQYSGPSSYGQQGPQQGGYGQPRGGASRGGHSSSHGSQAGRGPHQSGAAPGAPAAKTSRVLKITNPADGAEVHVDQVKKADKAISGEPGPGPSMHELTTPLVTGSGCHSSSTLYRIDMT